MEGLLRVRQLNRLPRRTGLAKSISPAWPVRRAAGAVAVGILLTLGLSVPAAWAAGNGNPGPDPAPQASTSSGSGSGPAPDPSPQPSSGHSSASASASSSQSASPVVSASGIGIGSSSSTGTQTTPQTTPTVAPAVPAPPVVTRPARKATPRVHAQPHLTIAAGRLVSPWRLHLFPSTSADTRAISPSRNGLLLLGTALALAVLALASGSLLRMLRQMQRVQPR